MSTITISALITGSNGFKLPLASFPYPTADAAAYVADLNTGTAPNVTTNGVLVNGLLSVSCSFNDSNNPRLRALANGAVYTESMGPVAQALWLTDYPSGASSATGTLVASYV
jgi:hypothetical protein